MRPVAATNAYAHLRPSRSYSEPPAPHHHHSRHSPEYSPSPDRHRHRDVERAREGDRERSSRHSSHASDRSKSGRKKRTTPTTGAFLGSLGGGLLGDMILPGLGTLGGAVLGGYRGYEVGKGPRPKRQGHYARGKDGKHYYSESKERYRDHSRERSRERSRDGHDGRHYDERRRRDSDRGRVRDEEWESESGSDSGRSMRSGTSSKNWRKRLSGGVDSHGMDRYDREYELGRRRRNEI